MFARKYRLPATARLAKPIIHHSPFFILRIAKNSLAYNRYGFIVSKKIDKRAVVRNRIKRRIRTCVEQLHPKLVFGNDLLFLIKKEALNQKTKEICLVLENILLKKD